MGNLCIKHANTVSPLYSSPKSDTPKAKSSSHKDSSLGSELGSAFSNGDVSRHDSAKSANGGILRPFLYSEMKAATRNFRSDGRLGEGGFGVVYKGYLDEQTLSPVKPGHGMTVAIKKLNLEGTQGHAEWVTEVKFLGALRHPNIVRLLGFCAEDINRLLVYEHMSRGSLESHLFRYGSQTQGLSWENRMKIAVGSARGLAFLHDSERHVIYRDVKAANVLLDDQFNAKLSDFGLAKDGPMGDDTHVSTRVMGTYGYAAPEYLATGHLTTRSDVYSFGVMLLELLSGRRAMDTERPYGEQKVVEWAKPFLINKKKVLHIIDPKLNGQYSLKGVHRTANLALQCLNDDAKARPLMKEVVESLEPLLISSRKK
ncbi:hypothetical protein GOP47_0004147 [Adiantum capillus-veneris]|uniref:non-specific serine/threonine protein kinase n=1 Tax=Adiantum capillus-veneris TaxID=13818 RepID=A0A9D4ZML4_ADICA|nr:hypothetical protein GOP47_0004147 [Adiantum capillus-veneris]